VAHLDVPVGGFDLKGVAGDGDQFPRNFCAIFQLDFFSAQGGAKQAGGYEPDQVASRHKILSAVAEAA
jgi:hypothetical protein